jgi:hypothetical protein
MSGARAAIPVVDRLKECAVVRAFDRAGCPKAKPAVVKSAVKLIVVGLACICEYIQIGD